MDTRDQVLQKEWAAKVQFCIDYKSRLTTGNIHCAYKGKVSASKCFECWKERRR